LGFLWGDLFEWGKLGGFFLFRRGGGGGGEGPGARADSHGVISFVIVLSRVERE